MLWWLHPHNKFFKFWNLDIKKLHFNVRFPDPLLAQIFSDHLLEINDGTASNPDFNFDLILLIHFPQEAPHHFLQASLVVCVCA